MTAAAVQQPNPQEFLNSQVVIPAFFDKLAAHGIPAPTSEDEARAFIDLGVRLLHADRLEQTKQASTRLGFLKNATEKLDKMLSDRYGMTPQAGQKEAEDQIVADAKALLQFPNVKAACEALLQPQAAAA